MILKLFIVLFVIVNSVSSCVQKAEKMKTVTKVEPVSLEPLPGEAVATFASGCFWCVEEIYESVMGVREVISGYAGGKAEDANYDAVSNGLTDHAETAQVYYDPKVITFEDLTTAFFAGHDPTTLNRQGPDVGRQYRSIAFYRNEAEKEIILNKIDEINQSGEFKNPIVTEVVPFTAFYPAESYHQDYILRNPNEPYVRGVSIPRYEEFKKKYKGKMKN